MSNSWHQHDEEDMGYRAARGSLKHAWEGEAEGGAFDDHEPHVRYAFQAHRDLGDSDWTPEVEGKLQSHWPGEWDHARGFVQRAWQLLRTNSYVGRPPLVAKPLNSLPETPKSQPAVTNGSPDATHNA